MKFKKEDLQDLASGDFDDDVFDVVENELVDSSRWSVHYVMVFKYKDKFYDAAYSSGATESQDESPFEYDDDEIECHEVVQVEKMVKVWERKLINKE